MPELPEVETVRRILHKEIVGKTIVNVKVFYPKMIIDIDYHDFIEQLKNKKIIDIKRKGKYLIFCFDNFYLLSHLRMEGKYYIKQRNEKYQKHEHVVFELDDGKDLRYHDTRKFGIMLIKEDLETKPLCDLGPEPWDLSLEYLEKKLKKAKPIKELLLDQKIISGLGNIYADEVCARCKLDPSKKGTELLTNDIKLIIEMSQKVLEEAIMAGGTTIRSYTSSLGVSGRFQQSLYVHTKESCRICGGKIVKIFIGGRGTYYCPFCQKEKVVIGLTGGISTGKSTVGKYIKEKYSFIDCDQIVHNIWEKDDFLFKMATIFNSTDKKEIAQIVFNNSNKKRELEEIIHPLVKLEVNRELADKKGIVFIDVPLLFESGFDNLCDYSICIYLQDEKAVDRLMKRNNYSYDDALKRVRSQMPIEQKKKKATFFIDNSASKEQSYKRFDEIMEEIKKCQ